MSDIIKNLKIFNPNKLKQSKELDNWRPLTVLIVEDNPADIHLIQMALSYKKNASELCVATDGEEALAFLNHEPGYEYTPRPDIIILDLNLPNLSGHEVLERIKNDPNLKQIPVIIYSTSTLQKDIQRCYSGFANCYITKPSNLSESLDVMNKIEAFWLSTVNLCH